jgi:Rrf2 family protein
MFFSDFQESLMLNQAVGYAATAMAYIASMDGRPVLVREIARDCNIPAPYLSKIIHTLGRQGLVLTQRGVGGGVVLSRAAAEISLYDLCLALGDDIVEAKCLLGTAECSDERACPAHAFWCEQRERMSAFLRTTFVSDLAAFESRHKGFAKDERSA